MAIRPAFAQSKSGGLNERKSSSCVFCCLFFERGREKVVCYFCFSQQPSRVAGLFCTSLDTRRVGNVGESILRMIMRASREKKKGIAASKFIEMINHHGLSRSQTNIMILRDKYKSRKGKGLDASSSLPQSNSLESRHLLQMRLNHRLLSPLLLPPIPPNSPQSSQLLISHSIQTNHTNAHKLPQPTRPVPSPESSHATDFAK